MENNKVNLKEVMGYARGQLIGKYGIAICVALLPVLLETLVSTLTTSGTTTSGMLISVLISVIVNLLIGVLVYGQTKVFLCIARGDKAPTMSLFFESLKENLDKAILIQVPFTLTSLLSIVPAILYRLGILHVPDEKLQAFELLMTLGQFLLIVILKSFVGMAFYILADHPEMDAGAILNKSIEMLSGYRLKYLLIYLVTFPLLLASFVACFVGVFWFQAYLLTIISDFYLVLNGEKPWSIEDEKRMPNDDNISF